jgi:hypothetical protein
LAGNENKEREGSAMAVLIVKKQTLINGSLTRKREAESYLRRLQAATNASGFNSHYVLKRFGVKVISQDDTGTVTKWKKTNGYSIWKDITPAL